jgi:carbon-monoxide dehydrogenase medium subunit
MKPAAFAYSRPDSLAQAVRDLSGAEGETKLIAGGQSLGPMMNLRLAKPSRLIDVSRLPELRGCSQSADHVSIGAAVTHAEIEDGVAPDALNGLLRSVAGRIAYRAVRNKGTIGGSLAHADPAADWLAALVAADAWVVAARSPVKTQGRDSRFFPGILSARRQSEPDVVYRKIAVDQLVLGAYTTSLAPGEVIARIEIAKRGGDVRWGYYKLCRKVGELADAIGAVVIDRERRYCRVVAGSVGGAPLALRAASSELAKTARAPQARAIDAELADLLPRLDPVKRQQLAVAVGRAILEALSQ